MMNLRVEVSISDTYSPGMRLIEDVNLDKVSFDDAADILKSFHYILQNIKNIKEKEKQDGR